MQISAAQETPPDAQHALAGIRAELERIRTCVGRIERGLNELESSAEDLRAGRQRSERYLRLLVDVYDRGGRHGVDPRAWAEIGHRHGYDRRGLGGFFTGARAPLARSGERVRLTMYGERLVDAYLTGLAR
jgi:hypothetical protein